MAMAIGYNINKAEEVVENVATKYTALGNYMGDEWPTVVDALHANWVGDDEADFEKKLAERINTLYSNSHSLAKSCVETICGLCNAWVEFQSKNTLDGSVAASTNGWFTDRSATAAKIKNLGTIVKADPPTLDGNTDRGLTSESSATTIKTTVETYVNGIKTKTSELFGEIDSNSAFFGEQTSSINSYIEKCGTAIAEVSVAIKDLYDALDTLAGSSYGKASSDVATQITEGASSVAEVSTSLGESRWS